MPIRFVSASESTCSDHAHRGVAVHQTERGCSKPVSTEFGAKYMARFGYKGGGLGANEQGIVDPIQVELRPKNMGLGFTHHHHYQNKANVQEVRVPVEKEYLVPYSRKNSCLKRTSRAYPTLAERLLDSRRNNDFPVVQKIIDMRGPDVCVLSDLKNFKTEQQEQASGTNLYRRDSVFDCDMVGSDAYLCDSVIDCDMVESVDLDIQEERETRVRKERKKREACESEKRKKEVIKDRVLDRIEEKNSAGTLTLEFLVETFRGIRRYNVDCMSLDLSSVAYSYALPLLYKLFQGWDPLRSPAHGLEVFRVLRKLLVEKYYADLVMDVVFPVVRVTITNYWQVRYPEPVLRFLEAWYEILPLTVMQTILDNVVFPKIVASVESWDPVKETVPIDCWIHPWVPLLGEKLKSCYDTIRIGFATVLHGWEPSDVSVYHALSPWKGVFDSSSWNKLIVRYIVPKLSTFMQNLQVNRANEEVDQFHMVRIWASVIHVDHMVQLLDVFFDKWQEVLYQWLCSNPKFEEVGTWFLGWKELIPVELHSNEHIQYRLSIGLHMMNQAAEGLEVSRPLSKGDFSHSKKRRQRPCESQSQTALQGNDVTELSLKEIIEIYAQENGILFKPKDGRSKDGRQIYGFGKVIIVFDSLNQNVYAKFGGEWSLVSLEQLLEFQNSKL